MDKQIRIMQHLYPKIDSEVVEKIIRSQFLFVKDAMEQGEYQTIMLQYLGKFAVKTTRLKKIQEKYDK